MVYGLVDCNNFFCSCERVFHPELEDKPIVVLSNNDGCVIARSNETKALGVKMGGPYYQVRDLLAANKAAVFSSNHRLYGEMSRRVMSLLSRYTPDLSVYSVDEAFMDLTGIPDLANYARKMVAYVRKGTGIPVSMGIAPTKTLAKMASKFAKQYKGYEGVCIIDSDEKREKALSLFDISDVWGIGRKSGKKLKAAGVTNAYDFVNKPASWVQSMFTVSGLSTWKELQGIDCIAPEELPFRKSICNSRSFPGKGLNSRETVEEAVADYAASCSRKLREQHTVCASMTVFAHTSRFRTDCPSHYIQADHHFEVATNSLTEIVKAAVDCLRRHWPSPRVSSGYYYKKAGVILWNITGDDSIQGSLFDPVDRDRQHRLMESIDAINHTKGKNTVRVAVQGNGQNGFRSLTNHTSGIISLY